MRIVVSGATGFLGGHLVGRLLTNGHAVTGLGRNREAGARLAERGARFAAIDLATTNKALVAERADAFVHCAALSSNWGARAAFQAANVTGTANAIELARRLGVGRFVHISSPSVYFRFADQLAVAEDMPLPPPINAYAASKAEAERMVLDAADLNPLILRPRGLFGPGDTALLPRLVRAARRGPLPLLRSGEAVTDLTFVDDVVAAIVAALDVGPEVTGKAINISGGEPQTIRHIAESAARHAGVTVRWRAIPLGPTLFGVRAIEAIAANLPSRPEPVVTAYSLGVLAFSQTLDISRAKALLGWQPRIGFAEGLSRL